MKSITLFILTILSSLSLAEINNEQSEYEKLTQEAGVETKAVAGKITGRITKVMVGNDNHYGTRFYLAISSDTTDTNCDSRFVYTEPNPITTSAPVDISGFQSKVSVFLSAYIANKDVSFTVKAGRGGYCRIVEGYME